MSEPQKKRGRPPLSPEQRASSREKRVANANAYHKSTGWAAQKKYRAQNAANIYEPKVRLRAEFKPVIERLVSETGMSMTQLCVSALESKYGVILHNDVDTRTKK